MGSPAELTDKERALAFELADEIWRSIDEDREPNFGVHEPDTVLWLLAGELRMQREERRFAGAIWNGLSENDRRMSKPDAIRMERGDFVRVSGLELCDICGVCYFDHASIKGARWLRRACDGRLIKL